MTGLTGMTRMAGMTRNLLHVRFIFMHNLEDL